MQCLSWKFKFLSSPFFSPTLSSNIRRNQPFSLYLLVWEKCSKISYTQTSRSFLFISGWLGVSNGNTLCVPTAKLHHGLSVLSLLLEIESLASLNLIILESQFQKHQKPFIKLTLKFCSFKATLSTKICIIQRSPEKLYMYIHIHICTYTCIYRYTDIYAYIHPEIQKTQENQWIISVQVWRPENQQKL